MLSSVLFSKAGSIVLFRLEAFGIDSWLPSGNCSIRRGDQLRQVDEKNLSSQNICVAPLSLMLDRMARISCTLGQLRDSDCLIYRADNPCPPSTFELLYPDFQLWAKRIRPCGSDF